MILGAKTSLYSKNTQKRIFLVFRFSAPEIGGVLM